MSAFEVPADCGVLFVNDVEQILGIATGASYMINNGRLVSRCEPLQHGLKYFIFPRVLGGKGGFGSMLRAIGAQIEKTTSREACRDLSGRRIRDVNNEKKLKDWVSKQAEREREKEEREERRRAKRAKYLEENPGKMDDPEFNAQYNQIMLKTEAAVQEGLAKMKEGGSTSKKRKADSNGTLDKYDRWSIVGGVDVDDLDSDSGAENSDSGDSNEARPSCSSSKPSHTITSTSSPSSSQSSEGAACASTSAEANDQSPTASATVTSSSESAGKDEGLSPSPCKVARLEDDASVSRGEECSSSSPDGQKDASSDKKKADRAEASSNGTSQTPESAGAVSSSGSTECTDPVDLDSFGSAEELQALGMERLKADLMRRGLKCGGNLQERAQRLFSVKGLAPDAIPPKLLAKGKGQGKSSQK